MTEIKPELTEVEQDYIAILRRRLVEKDKDSGTELATKFDTILNELRNAVASNHAEGSLKIYSAIFVQKNKRPLQDVFEQAGFESPEQFAKSVTDLYEKHLLKPPAEARHPRVAKFPEGSAVQL